MPGRGKKSLCSSLQLIVRFHISYQYRNHSQQQLIYRYQLDNELSSIYFLRHLILVELIILKNFFDIVLSGFEGGTP